MVGSRGSDCITVVISDIAIAATIGSSADIAGAVAATDGLERRKNSVSTFALNWISFSYLG